MYDTKLLPFLLLSSDSFPAEEEEEEEEEGREALMKIRCCGLLVTTMDIYGCNDDEENRSI